MEDQDKIIDELSGKLEKLVLQNQNIHREMQQLQQTIKDLKYNRSIAEQKVAPVQDKTIHEAQAVTVSQKAEAEKIVPPKETTLPSFDNYRDASAPRPSTERNKNSNNALEEFIGTNLLNKVGIAILVIGIGFGTKYAIDHELLSDLTRVILGYVASVALLATAIYLKKKYENFSAVLLSGGMAALYFVTYSAHAFYGLIPPGLTFFLMVVFTTFTCFAALQYNLQLIAVIGLVGAYAVPFLLSKGEDRVVVLFTYITIINSGILVLAFKKKWDALYYLAFAVTWLIFASWFVMRFDVKEHFWISLSFSTIFFVIFYITLLAHKLIRKEHLSRPDIVMVLLNSFLYFGFGYSSIDSLQNGESYLGLFAVFTALLHFITAIIIYRQQEPHRDVFYLVAGMVLVFLTLAVPIQLNGHWVTLVWASEALLLFWIGRTKEFIVYEKISFVMVALALGSLMQDWDSYYNPINLAGEATKSIPFLFNIQFLTSLWVAACFGLIVKIATNKKYKNPLEPGSLPHGFLHYGIPAMLILTLYVAFFTEIQSYWNQRYTASVIQIKAEGADVNIFDEDLLRFQQLWLINYSAAFLAILSFINYRFLKNQVLTYANVAFNALLITIFLTNGLLVLSSLRSTYLDQIRAEYFHRGIYNILIRYICLVFIAPLIGFNYLFVNKTNLFREDLQKAERVLFHLVILTLLSSELVHILNMLSIHNSFKLALSILWGTYALLLIILGLWKNQKHIRLTAIVLFGITLVKLFIYDMAEMSTIAKTIVMMILGILLLIASFLYNKYKRTNENP
jgi:uncharacterized membrane protein